MVAPLQSNSATLDPGAAAVTFLNNVVSGTKLIALICTGGGGNPQVTAIGDGSGHNMTKVGSAFLNNAAANGELSIWAMDTPTAGIKPTLTATQTGGNQSFGMVIQEVPGLAAGNTLAAMIDGTAATSTGSISSNGSVATGAYSTTAAGEYLIAVGGDNEASTITWGVPTGSTTYTRDPKAVNASVIFNCVPAYGNSTGGAETASFALTGVSVATPWATLIVAFKLGGASGLAQTREHRLLRTGRRHGAQRRILQPSFSTGVSPDLTLNAPPVIATGAAPQPVVDIDLPQTAPVATGVAPQATPNVIVLAGIPTATGAAPAPVPAPSAVAGVPTATGQAAAIVSGQILAGIPTATGVAPAPGVVTGLIVNAPVPTATGAAPQPVVAESVFAGIPTATGSAAAVANIQAKPGIPTATGAAPQPVVSEQVLAGIPVATGVAPAPGILTGLVVNAPAVTATGTAPGPVSQISPVAQVASATATPTQPVIAESVIAGAPTASGAAAAVANIRPVAGAPTATGNAAAIAAISVLAGIPVGTSVAPAPGILTGLVVVVPPAIATGSAPQPTVAEQVFAGIPVVTGSAPPTSRGVGAPPATASGIAPQPAKTIQVFPFVATAVGTAPPATPQSILPHVTARATSSVGARMTGTTAIADPREASSAVTSKHATNTAAGRGSKSANSTAVTEKGGGSTSVK